MKQISDFDQFNKTFYACNFNKFIVSYSVLHNVLSKLSVVFVSIRLFLYQLVN